MKKQISLVVLTLLVSIFMFVSCKSTQPLVQQQIAPIQPLKTEISLVTWYQSRRPELNKNDTLLFYNSLPIELSGTITKSYKSIKDGALCNIDSVFNIMKTVPARTPGRLTDVKRDKSGQIIEMGVLFSVSDKTYTLVYMLEDYVRYIQSEASKKTSRPTNYPVYDSGSFILNASATLLFRGEQFKVNAVTKGSEDEKLLVKDIGGRIVIDIKEKAEGQTTGSVVTSQPVEKNDNKEGTPSLYKPTH